MPKHEKGSPEAKAWGEKMKKAREAKGAPKKSIRGKGRDPSKEKDSSEIVRITRPATEGFPNLDEIRRRAIALLQEANMLTTNYDRLEWNARNQERMNQITDVLLTRLRQIPIQLRELGQTESAESVEEEIDRIESELIYESDSDMSGGMIMGYGIMGGRLLPIYDLKGGKVKGLNKTMFKLQDDSRKLNPFYYKSVRDKGMETGDVTNNQLLPAVVEAGMPLLYASAGTAGMMLGGPVGSAAAVKGTQMLYDEMVAKKGYDPRDRQQSEVLGAISKEAGKQGASQLKSKAKSASLTDRITASKKAEATGTGMRTMLRGKPVILVESKR